MMANKCIPFIITLVYLIGMPLIIEGKICYVSKNGSTNGPGDSWSTAYDDFATAIKSIQPDDSLFMAEGIYYLPSESVIVKYGIRLFGGFAGWESHPDERIPGLHETVIKGGGYYVKLELDSIYHPSILDRLTFSDGNAQFQDEECVYPVTYCAGGILLINAANGSLFRDITIRECTFKDNQANHGGAIAIFNYSNAISTFRFVQCTFDNNFAVYWSGGAIYYANGPNSTTNLLIDSCIFINNRTRAGYGGALYYNRTDPGVDTVRVTNSLFENNKCLTFGGGGGIAFQNYGIINIKEIFISNCLFKNNYTKVHFTHQAWLGGSALRLVKGGTVNDCVFEGNVSPNSSVLTGYGMTVEQSLFINNHSGGVASILVAEESQQLGQLVFHNTFRNCTFYNNKAAVSSPLFYRSYPRLQDTIINCVFLNNSNDSITPVFVSKWGADENNRLYANHIGGDVNPESFYLMLDSTGTSEFEPDKKSWYYGDPMFVDTAGGDFRLKRCSPLNNKGSNASVSWDTDLSGAIRIQGDTVDLGAYERERFMPEIDLMPATCAHDPDGAVLLEPEGYTPPATWLISDQMGMTHAHDRLSPGSYLATLIDGEQCGRVFTIDIAGPDSLQAWFLISGTTEGYASGRITIDSLHGGKPGYTIKWFDGSEGLSVEDLLPGIYTLTITDDVGCARMWEIEVPLINSLLKWNAIGHFSVSNPATGSLLYQWQPTGPVQQATYQLVNTQGMVVLSGTLAAGSGGITLTGTSTGYYQLVVSYEGLKAAYPLMVVR